MKKILLIIILISSLISAQNNPMTYQRWNIFNINKVRTEFNNTGLLCNGNQQSSSLAREPSFEYPAGSGFSWGTGVGVMIRSSNQSRSGSCRGIPESSK